DAVSAAQWDDVDRSTHRAQCRNVGPVSLGPDRQHRDVVLSGKLADKVERPDPNQGWNVRSDEQDPHVEYTASRPASARRQSYRSSTSWRPAWAMRFARRASPSRLNTALAKLRSSSAMSRCSSGRAAIPSTPIVVETTGIPRAKASRIFTRI